MILLYSKGADLAIFDRLSSSIEQHFLEATKEDLIKFSTKGYRTLCFAVRVLDEAYFKDWQIRFEAAKVELMKHGVNKNNT
jgi:magnesium-transporting ATPase (P-type)